MENDVPHSSPGKMQIAATAASVAWSSMCAWGCVVLGERLPVPDALILILITVALFSGHAFIWMFRHKAIFHGAVRGVLEALPRCAALPAAFLVLFGALVFLSDTDPDGKVSALTLLWLVGFAWILHGLELHGIAFAGWEKWLAFAVGFLFAVALGGWAAAPGAALLWGGVAMLLGVGPSLVAWTFRMEYPGDSAGRGRG